MRACRLGLLGCRGPLDGGVHPLEEPRVAESPAGDHHTVAFVSRTMPPHPRPSGCRRCPAPAHLPHPLPGHDLRVDARGVHLLPGCGRAPPPAPRPPARRPLHTPLRSHGPRPSPCASCTVTGRLVFATTCSTMRPQRSGSSISLLPAPPDTILGAGQPMLISTKSNSYCSMAAVASPMISGTSPKICTP